MFVVEGVHLVSDAVNSGADVKSVLVTRVFMGRRDGKYLLERLADRGTEIVLVKEELFLKISETESPQGILAVCGIGSGRDVREVLHGGDLFAIVDGVQEPGNLGTMIRSADAAGAKALFLTRGTVDPYNPKVIRASAGSIFHIPALEVQSLEELVPLLEEERIMSVAGDARATKSLYELDLTGRVAFIVGNEARGSPKAVRLADEVAAIPVIGRSESLNVAVAASIMLYEAVRQRLYAMNR